MFKLDNNNSKSLLFFFVLADVLLAVLMIARYLQV